MMGIRRVHLLLAGSLILAPGTGFATDGGQIWTHQMNPTPVLNESFASVADAGGGKIIIVGTRSVSGQGLDVWVQKMDARLRPPTVIWTITINGADAGGGCEINAVNSGDRGLSVAVDKASGAVYVGGRLVYGSNCANSATVCVFVSRLDPATGVPAWTRSWFGSNKSNPPAETAGINSLKVDMAGNIVGIGTIRNAVQEAWMVKLDPAGNPVTPFPFAETPVTSPSEGYGITVDDTNNIYATGSTYSAVAGNDYYIRKYMPSGVSPAAIIVWTRTGSWMLGAPFPDIGRAITVDRQSSLLVVGSVSQASNNSEMWLSRWGLDGTWIWSRTRMGAGSYDDYLAGVDTDEDGHLFVTGVMGNASGTNIWTAKMTPDGMGTLWMDEYDGPSMMLDAGLGIAYLGGSVVSVGTDMVSASDMRMWARKYDTCIPKISLGVKRPIPLYAGQGELIEYRISFSNSASQTAYNLTLVTEVKGGSGIRTYSAPSLSATLFAGGGTVARAYSVTSNTGPWIAGEAGVAEPVYLMWEVSNLPPKSSGVISFATEMTVAGAPQNLEVFELGATCSCDSSKLTGAFMPISATVTGRRLPPAGKWMRIENGGMSNTDRAHAVAVGPNRDIYAAGMMWGATTLYDWRICRYDGDGNLVSSTDYNGAAAYHEEARAIAVDSSGLVYVAGYKNVDGVNTDWLVRKYSPDLSVVLAEKTFGGVDNSNDTALGIAINPNGDIIVVGSEYYSGANQWKIIRYDASLTVEIASTSYRDPSSYGTTARGVSTDKYGNIYVVGGDFQGLPGWTVHKYSPDLDNRIAKKNFTGSQINNDIVVDGNGYVYVGGMMTDDFYVAKLGPGLEGPIDSDYYNGGLSSDECAGLSLDSSGNLVAVGYAIGGSAMDWVIRKYDSSFNLLQMVTHAGIGNNHDRAYRVAASGSTSLFVAGEELFPGEDTNFSVAKYDLLTFTNPTAPQALSSYPRNTQVYLNWAPATAGMSALSGYNIYRATCLACAYQYPPVAKLNLESTTYIDTGLTNGNYYRYTVRARDMLDNESQGNLEVEATPSSAKVNPPSCVVFAQRGASNVVSLQWCTPGWGDHPATAYAVYRNTYPGFDISHGAVAILPVSATVFVDRVATMIPNSFYYHLRSLGSLSDPSPGSAGITINGNPPTVPANLTARTGMARIHLGWDASGMVDFPVMGYFIYRSTTWGEESPAYVGMAGPSATFWDDNDVAEGVSYFYTVNAYDDQGPPNESGASNEATAWAISPLKATLYILPKSPLIGSGLTVILSITNQGTGFVNGVSATLMMGTGEGLVSLNSGPGTIASISPGEHRVFMWSYNTIGNGPFQFSAIADGFDMASANQVNSIMQNADGLISPLRASMAVYPNPVSSDNSSNGDIYVTLTVTNEGSSWVDNVAVPAFPEMSGTGSVNLFNADTGPFSIGPGLSKTFYWRFDVAGNGRVVFSASASGDDLGYGGTPPDTFSEKLSRELVINPLKAHLAFSANPVVINGSGLEDLRVWLTVTNTGTLAVQDVTPPVDPVSGGTAVYSLNGWDTSPRTINPGNSYTFYWSYNITSNGDLSITASVWGDDDSVSNPLPDVYSEPVSGHVVVSPLKAFMWAAPSPARGDVGWDNDFTVYLTVSNQGTAEVYNVAVRSWPLITKGDTLVTQYGSSANPQNIPPGQARTYMWYYNVEGNGNVVFTASAWGEDQAIPPNLGEIDAYSNPVMVEQALQSLDASVAMVPRYAASGQPGPDFEIHLTVTNNGGSVVNSVFVPNMPDLSGSAFVSKFSGPDPTVPQGLGIGGSVTFTWRFDVTQNGTLSLSVSAWGDDQSFIPDAGDADTWSNTCTLQFPVSPLVISRWTLIPPNPVSDGNGVTPDVEIRMTVSNYGGQQVQAVRPPDEPTFTAGMGNLGLIWSAVAPNAINPGGDYMYVWAYSINSNGPVSVSASAWGDDWAILPNSGGTDAWSEMSGTGFNVSSLVALIEMVPNPAAGGAPGDDFEIRMTVTNSNPTENVNNVSAQAWPVFLKGAGLVSQSTSSGGMFNLGSYESCVFTWRYGSNGNGPVEFTASAWGEDQSVGLNLPGEVDAHTPEAVGQGAINSLTSSLAVAPSPAIAGMPGYDIQFYLTVTNTGYSAVQNLTAPSGPDIVGASLSWMAGPGGSVTLNPGASHTFTWSYEAMGNGPIQFSVSCWGDDQSFLPNSGETDIQGKRETIDAVISPLTAEMWIEPNPAHGNGAPGDTDMWLRMKVTNNGTMDVKGVMPPMYPMIVSGGGVNWRGGDYAWRDLGPGQSYTFYWEYDISANGGATFSASAWGDDQYVVAPTPDAYSNVATATAAIGPLRAGMTISPNPSADEGGAVGDFMVYLTVTNTGTMNVNTLVAPNAPEISGEGQAHVFGSNLGPTGNILPGQSYTFWWHMEIDRNGPMHFSASCWGDDLSVFMAYPDAYSNSGTATAYIAPLRTRMWIEPAQVCTDGALDTDFIVYMSVSNAGGSIVTGVAAPDDLSRAGNGSASLQVESNGPVALDPGESVVFSWNYNADANGRLEFTATAWGDDQGMFFSFPDANSNPSSAVVDINPLQTAISSQPTQVVSGKTGWDVAFYLTVTNTGSEDVRGVSAPSSPDFFEGGGLLTWLAGPGSAVDLGPGQSHTFTWGYDATGNGRVVFSVSCWGDDWGVLPNSGGVDVYGERREIARTISPLVAEMWVEPNPAHGNGVGGDTDMWLRMKVTNNGTMDVKGVMPPMYPMIVSGGGVNWRGGDYAWRDLGPGHSYTFYWEYDISANGGATFSASAWGDDQYVVAPTPDAYTNMAVATANISPLQASMSVSPNPASDEGGAVGDFMVYLTVTNTGTMSVDTVRTIADPFVHGPGGANVFASDTGPYGPIPSGGSHTFWWHMEINSNGPMRVSASAWGDDQGIFMAYPDAWSGVESATVFITPLSCTMWVVPPQASSDGAPNGDFTVYLSVTNTGGWAVDQVTASNYPLLGGSGNVTPWGQFTGPINLFPGSNAVFTWKYDVDVNGTLSFTASAWGDDTLMAPNGVGVVDASTRPQEVEVVMSPLRSWMTAIPSTAHSDGGLGSDFSIVLTVSNYGGNAVNDVSAPMAPAVLEGAGLVDPPTASGGPFSLGPGQAGQFTWAYNVVGNGRISFSASAWGDDTTLALPIPDAYSNNSFATVSVSPIRAQLNVVPARAWADGVNDTDYEVHLLVTNEGTQTVDGIRGPGSPFITEGQSYSNLWDAQNNSPVSLAPGESATVMVWRYNVVGNGKTVFTASAWGDDYSVAPNGAVVDAYTNWATGEAISNPLIAEIRLNPPAPFMRTSMIEVILTVSNTGASPVVDLYPPAQPSRQSLGGSIMFAGGPNPAWFPVLNPGASADFTWVYTAMGNGKVAITASAWGDDQSVSLFPVPDVYSPAKTTVAVISPLTTSFMVIPPVSSGGPGIVTVRYIVFNNSPLDVNEVTGHLWIQSGEGLVVPVNGSNYGPVTLSAWSSTEFEWNFDETGYGKVVFAVSATGDDQDVAPNAPGTVDAITAVETVTLEINPLSAYLSLSPRTATKGSQFQAYVDVTNSGAAPVSAVTASLQAVSGGSNIAQVSGPIPADYAVLNAGETARFTWTFDAVNTGTVQMSATGFCDIGVPIASNGSLASISILNGVIGTPQFIGMGEEHNMMLNFGWNPPLSWGDYGPGPSPYRVYRTTVPGTPPEQMTNFQAHQGAGIRVTGLTNGVRYWFAVTAVDAMGNEGPFTQTVSGVPFEPPAPFVVSWSALPFMNTPRASFGLVAYNEYLYAVCGTDSGGGALSSIERFPYHGDPSSVWETLATLGDSPEMRVGPGVALAGSDIIVAGGRNGVTLDTMQKFHIDSLSWENIPHTGFTPVSDMAVGKMVYGDNPVFLGGEDAGTPTNAIQLFDLGSSSWSFDGFLSSQRSGAAAAQTHSGYIFTAGGTTFGGVVVNNHEGHLFGDNYDAMEAPLPSARTGAIGFGFGERAYFVGGWASGVYMDEVLEYELATKTWHQRTPYPFTVQRGAACYPLDNGKVYIAGGEGDFGPATAKVYEGSAVDAVPHGDKIGVQWGFSKGTFDLATFNIYRSTYGFENMYGNMGPPKGTVGGTATLWDDTDVTPGKTYIYLVEALDSQGHMSLGYDGLVMPVEAPTGLVATAGSNQVALEWNPVPDWEVQGIDHYEVYRATYAEVALDPSFGMVVGGCGPTQGTTVDSSAMNGTTYFYVVRAISSVTGPGTASNVAVSTPFYINPPTMPASFMVTGRDDQTVELQWQQSAPGDYDVSGYRVYRSTGPDIDPMEGDMVMEIKLPFPTWIGSTILIDVTDQIAPMESPHTYNYRVEAFDTWDPPTRSIATAPMSAMPGNPSWRMARADGYGTGRNPSARGLYNGAALYWSYDTGSNVDCEPVTSLPGEVYFTSGDKLIRLSKAGALLASQPMYASAIATRASPLITYEKGNLSGVYSAFALPDGRGGISKHEPWSLFVAWSVTLPGGVDKKLLPVPDGRIVVADNKGNLSLISPDAEIQWTRSFPGKISDISLMGGGSVGIVVLCSDWKAYGLDILGGSLQGYIPLSGTPTGWINDVARGQHYVSIANGQLIVLSDNGMQITWSLTTNGSFDSGLAMSSEGKYAVANNSNGRVYWFSTENPASNFGSLPVPAVSKGNISIDMRGGSYWGDEGGGFWYGPPQSMEAFSLTVPEGGAMGPSSPALYDDGADTFAFIGSHNNRLYAFVNATGVPPAASAVLNGPNIELTWTPSGNTIHYSVSRYLVYRSTCLLCPYDFSATTWGPWATGYTDSTMAGPGVYRYRLRSVDDSAYSNISVPSNPVACSYGAVLPPENLSIQVEGSRYLTMSWSKPSSGYELVSGYEVYRGFASGGPYDLAGTLIGTTATGWMDMAMTNGVAVWYQVRARGFDDTFSGFSAEAGGTPFEPPAPFVTAWERFSSLQNGRWGHRMERWGDYLYVFGGENGGGMVGQMERSRVISPGHPLEDSQYYNWFTVTTTGTFEPRRYFGSVAHNGSFYAAGGTDGLGYLNNVRRFDPSTSAWIAANSAGFTGYEGLGMGVEPVFGTLYTQYGENGVGETTAIQEYRTNFPFWNSWAAGGNTRAFQAYASGPFSFFSFGGYQAGMQLMEISEYIPLSQSQVPGHGGTGVALERASAARLGERMYVVGGWNGGSVINVVREYDPDKKTLQFREPLPDSGMLGAAMIEMDGRLVVTGGRNSDVDNNARREMFIGKPLHVQPANCSATLMWGFDAGTYALASYSIYRSTWMANGPAGAGTPIATGLAPATSLYLDGKITNGNFYLYYVEATDAQGHKSWIWDMARVSPSQPTGLVATPGSGSVKLDWTPLPNQDNENVHSYSIYRSTVGGEFKQNYEGGSWQLSGWDDFASGTYTVYGLDNGTTYYFRVRANSEYCGEGPPSGEAMATPSFIAPPTTPTGMVATSGRDQVVQLAWNDSSAGGEALSGYYVFRTTLATGSPMMNRGRVIGRVLYPLGTPSPAFLDQTASLAFGKTFRYSVVAFDDWDPPTYSGESAVVSGAGIPAGWKSARGDGGCGYSVLADGLTTSLALKFAYQVGGTVYCTPAVSSGGTVYFTASDGYFYAINANGGDIGKTPLAGGTMGTASSPAIAYADSAGSVDRVYVGSASGGSGYLNAFKSDGSLAWSAGLAGAVTLPPVVTASGDVIALDDTGKIWEFDRTGTLVWSKTVAGKPVGAPVATGAEVVMATNSGWIFGMNAISGELMGGMDLSATISGFIMDDDTDDIIISTVDGRVLMINKDSVVWSVTVNGDVSGALAYDPVNGQVVIGTVDGYACGGNPGGDVGCESTGAPIRGSPVISAGGTIYFADDAGVMHEWDKNGNPLSSCKVPGGAPFGGASPALWEDTFGKTRIYIGGASTKLYCFMNAPSAPAGLNAIARGTGIELAWEPSTPGVYPVSGYYVARATCAKCQSTLLDRVIGVYSTGYTDASAEPYAPYYYQVVAFDDSPFLNPGVSMGRVFISTTVTGTPSLTLAFKNPEPVYARTAEAQQYRLSFSNGGESTFYNVVVTTRAGSFAGRGFVMLSTGNYSMGGAIEKSWATSLGGPWFPSGDPANNTTDPLFLRWTISTVPPGASGEMWYSVRPNTGTEVIRESYASATMSFDPGLASNAELPYSTTAYGKEIIAPLAWMRTHNSAGTNSDWGQAVAVNGPTGNVYLAGTSIRSDIGEDNNHFLRKLDPAGVPAWTVEFNGPENGKDEAFGVAVGDADSPVVAGIQQVSGQPGWILNKYDGTGALAWSRTTQEFSGFKGVASDSAGNIAVAGFKACGADGWNLLVQKWSSAGVLQWSQTWNSGPGQDDEANGVAMDQQGNVIVAGAEFRGDLTENWNWRVIKYSASGVLMWSRTFNGIANSEDRANAVATDQNGNIYVTGSEMTAGQGFNWMTNKYDPDGNYLFSQGWDAALSNDVARGIVVDSQGNMTVAGTANSGGDDDWQLVRYDSYGNPMGTHTHESIPGSNNTANAAALIPGSQNVMVAGTDDVLSNGSDAVVARYNFTPFNAPGPPTTFVANASLSMVLLGWDVPTAGTNPLNGYRVFRSTTPGFIPSESNFLALVPNPAVTYYQDSTPTPGEWYYYRVRARDTAGNEGLNSAEAEANITPSLSLSVVSATYYDFGPVTGGSINVSSTTFDIKNDGNVPATLSLSVTNTAGTWAHTTSGSAGYNEYELDAQFNFPDSPASWDFAYHALPVVPPGPIVSDANYFAGNENGMALAINDRRHLWLRLHAPSSTSDAGKQRFVISITAQTP